MNVNKELCGTTVFACKFTVPEDEIRRNCAGDFTLCWDVYGTEFNRVRTVCYGTFTPAGRKDCKTVISGIALLHRKYPEEFDVKIGIYKSFGRAVTVIANYYQNMTHFHRRMCKKEIWEYFEREFTKDFTTTSSFPFGIWMPSWTQRPVTLDNNNLERLFIADHD